MSGGQDKIRDAEWTIEGRTDGDETVSVVDDDNRHHLSDCVH